MRFSITTTSLCLNHWDEQVLSIHYKKQCHFVHDIVINVPTKSRQRKTQPHCVIAGKGVLTIKDNVGLIN